MKIIVSPAKEMKEGRKTGKDWDISPKTKELVEVLERLDSKEVGSILKIKGDLLEKNKKYIQNFQGGPSFYAIELYNGLAFRNMEVSSMGPKEKAYLGENLIILSALYGLVKAFTKIKPYRLDFNTPLKVQGQSLRSFWKEDFNQGLPKNEIILNLASKEFSELFNKEDFTWIDFDFYEWAKGKEKRHSTISKKARGKMVSFLCRNQVDSLDGVKKFNFDGYQFDREQSTEKRLVFYRIP